MIGGFTRLLQQRYGGQLDAEADRYIGFAVDGVARIQRLLEELLAHARVGADEAGLGSVDSAAVVRDVIVGLHLQIEESGGRVELGELSVVGADRSQLLQVFQNLISNALKFRAENRPLRVRVTTVDRGDDWCFSVSDNGLGIEPKYFERVFVMFQRLHNRTSHAGSGIGLAVCRKIVLRHGGTIWITRPVRDVEPDREPPAAAPLPCRSQRRVTPPRRPRTTRVASRELIERTKVLAAASTRV